VLIISDRVACCDASVLPFGSGRGIWVISSRRRAYVPKEIWRRLKDVDAHGLGLRRCLAFGAYSLGSEWRRFLSMRFRRAQTDGALAPRILSQAGESVKPWIVAPGVETHPSPGIG
jgi:hypothetical protein